MTKPFRRSTRESASIALPDAVVVTPEEYDALTPDSRIELVDGVLHVMTPPTARHQIIMRKLVNALVDVCPAHLAALHEQEIRLAPDHRRNPDVLVVRAGAVNLDDFSFQPADVLLAVEVVSPGTQTADRRHKPLEYADAGIRFYWRVEPVPELTVFTYRLNETDVYEFTGAFRDGDTIVATGIEWARIEVCRLAP
jgi:Uma2 family endonuclease